jgi:hypothetical protein
MGNSLTKENAMRIRRLLITTVSAFGLLVCSRTSFPQGTFPTGILKNGSQSIKARWQAAQDSTETKVAEAAKAALPKPGRK